MFIREKLFLIMLVINYEEINNDFQFPYRMFISGSSQSGKTTFAGKLLRSDLFDKVDSIHYYHPDYLEECPVNWHNEIDIPVSYKANLPTLAELCNLREKSCVVLDDLYEECINSKAIDYLFRVLSGKKKLCVIIMSQQYFARGRFNMNIRNNVNFTVLMRNTDARVNKMIAKLLDVTKEVNMLDDRKPYSNVLIDNSPRSSGSSYKVYYNIFDSYPIVASDDGMRGYVIPEKDFDRFFNKLNKYQAEVRDANTTENKGTKPVTQSLPESPKCTKEEFRAKLQERAKRLRMARKTREIISRNKEHPKLFSKNN